MNYIDNKQVPKTKVYLVKQRWEPPVPVNLGPFVTKGDSSIDTLLCDLGVSVFKGEDWCPYNSYTFRLDIITLVGSKFVTCLENNEPGFS